jgi:hypothetical protein
MPIGNTCSSRELLALNLTLTETVTCLSLAPLEALALPA